MSTRLITRIFPFTDHENHSSASWRRQLKARSDRQSDRERLIAFFMD